MKILRAIILSVLATAVAAVSNNPLTRRAGPDPREIPLPPIKTLMGNLPDVNDLPVRTANAGRDDDERRHQGHHARAMAATPTGNATHPRVLFRGAGAAATGNVKGTEIKSQLLANGKYKYRLVHLTFGPDEKLYLDIGIFTPTEGGPFPTVIAWANTPPGGTPQPKVGNGPNQGRGQDVLLLVGKGDAPAPTAAGDTPARSDSHDGGRRARRTWWRSRWRQSRRHRREQRGLARGYAYVMYSNNDCGEDTTLRELDGSWSCPQGGLFSRLSEL